MIVGRVLGWLLILAALVVAGGDLYAWIEGAPFHARAVGEVWYQVHPGSLNLSQAAIQRYIHPALWDPVIVTVLLWPAAAVLGGMGILLAFLCRRRSRSWFRS